MPDSSQALNKDVVLATFLQVCPSPAAQDTAEWCTKYPQFAADIASVAKDLRSLDRAHGTGPATKASDAELEQEYRIALEIVQAAQNHYSNGGASPDGLRALPIPNSATTDRSWQKTFGSRLKAARYANNVSEQTLALATGSRVEPGLIQELEADAAYPDVETIKILARTLEVSSSYLINADRLRMVDLSPRNAHKLSAEQLRLAEVKAISFAHRYLDLETRLGEIAPEFPQLKMRGMDEAELAAERIRAIWNLGDSPIASLATILENQGVKIFPLKLKEFDGLALRIEGEDRPDMQLIVLAEGLPISRTRFTLAHELAHLFDPRASEDSANRFAGALLLPAKILQSRLGPSQHVGVDQIIRLKEEYGVSAQAIAYRCHDLGLVDLQGRTALLRSLDDAKELYEIADLGGFSEQLRRFEQLKARVREVN